MVTISNSLALALWGNQIPFLRERHYLKRKHITKDHTPESITDVWDALALLVQGRNDNSERCILKANSPENEHGISVVRVAVFSSGYTKDCWTRDYDFPVSTAVVDECVRNQYVIGTPQWGYTDKSRLTLTECGVDALIKHIGELPQAD